MNRKRSARVALVVAVLLMLGLAGGSAKAERHSTTPTGWGWYAAATPATVASFINTYGMRLIDIEVVDDSPLLLSAALVRNAGTHYRPSWHWYYGLTFTQLVNLSVLSTERPLDVEVYPTSNGNRYAVVTVNNQGTYAKSWWWYLNVSPSYISGVLSGRRIVDIDPRPADTDYNVILEANTGSNYRPWWYYYKRTPAKIASLLSTNGGRLVDIEPNGSGTFTIVMVKYTSSYWWWYYGLTSSQVTEKINQLGVRVVDIERYSTTLGTRYAVILLNNLDAFHTLLREKMRPYMQNAAYGFYLKQVGGPVYASLQPTKVFEPASTVKVVHHLTAMRAVKAGTKTLTGNVTWYAHPTYPARYVGDPGYRDGDPNTTDHADVCAYASDGTPLTSVQYSDDLGPVILKQMMQQSDNRNTDSIWNLFGQSALNSTAATTVGMTQTYVYHRIGCTGNASPAGFHQNETTLKDLGLLYEKVANGTLLGTGFYRDTFYGYMLTSTGGWRDVVEQEAVKLGKCTQTAVNSDSCTIANSFLTNMRTAVKGGSYTNGATCPSGVSGVCTTFRRTGFGRLALPHKVSGSIVRKEFVYGSFVDGTFLCGTDCDGELTNIGNARKNVQFEMVRPRIKAALATW